MKIIHLTYDVQIYYITLGPLPMENGYHHYDMMIQVSPTGEIKVENDDNKEDNVELKKHVGLVSGIALIVGTMIGKSLLPVQRIE